MILFPNCKINIGLRITERRSDGYHELQTLFYPVRGWCDSLELLPSEATEGVVLSTSGDAMELPAGANLCEKAYAALARHTQLGGVRMHLHKVLPSGAGLGGGSADAAYVLRGLRSLFAPHLSDEELEGVAAEIGSDVPFFIKNRPSLATGRGEVLTPHDLTLEGYHLLLVKPPLSISTAEAYGSVTPRTPAEPLTLSLQRPIGEWREWVVNDFEESLFGRYAELAQIKERLYALGASYAAMSGSGSTLFALFEEAPILGDEFAGCSLYEEKIIA